MVGSERGLIVSNARTTNESYKLLMKYLETYITHEFSRKTRRRFDDFLNYMEIPALERRFDTTYL